MLSPSKVSLASPSGRCLILAGLLISLSTVHAETPITKNIESSVAAVQQSAAVSSLASNIQPATTDAAEVTTEAIAATKTEAKAEPVTPFYQKTDSQQGGAKTPPKIGSGGHLVNVALGLIAIIALIYALSQFVKRFGGGTFSGNSQLKILSSMPLGTRERIVLIDAGGQQLLLGITPTNINTLHVFTDPIVVDNKPEVQSDFSRKLMAILQQKPSSPSPNDKNDSAPQG